MEITWKIDSIKCLAQVDEYTNVVYDISWRTFATEGDHSTSVYGSATVSFDPSDVTEFVPYEELTEETVLDWVFDSLGEERQTEIEGIVTNALQDIITPKVINNPLPWATV